MVERGIPTGKPPLPKEELDLRMQLAEIEDALIEMRQKMETIESDAKYAQKEEEMYAMEEHQSRLAAQLQRLIYK